MSKPRTKTVTTPNSVLKSAYLSEDGAYRYWLKRRWATGPLLGFVMLNPSTADHQEDDPTIRRCMGFARRYSFSGIYVTNLMAVRATDPAELTNYAYPSGPDNHTAVSTMLEECPRVVAAWGDIGGNWANREFGAFMVRRQVQAFSGIRHLGSLTKRGNPRHPLYLPADALLLSY